jgi:glycine/serine hydroxymethyltransferase
MLESFFPKGPGRRRKDSAPATIPSGLRIGRRQQGKRMSEAELDRIAEEIVDIMDQVLEEDHE